jgi:hypothetical protein
MILLQEIPELRAFHFRSQNPVLVKKKFTGKEIMALEKTSFLITLQGLRPAAMAPQLRLCCITWIRISGNTEESQAPPPPTGVGLAQGGLPFLKGISPERIFSH